MKLNRCDRASLALAYECLRVNGVRRSCYDYQDPRWYYDEFIGICEALAALALPGRETEFARLSCERVDEDTSRIELRLLRARMALLIRVVLRVGADDFGKSHQQEMANAPLRCSCCSVTYPDDAEFCEDDYCNDRDACLARGKRYVRLPISPLWERAPKTRMR